MHKGTSGKRTNFIRITGMSQTPKEKKSKKSTSQVGKSGRMDLKTKTKARSKVDSHPYSDLEGTHLWAIVSTAVEDLVNNSDLQERTPRAYIVGLICRRLLENGIAVKAEGRKPPVEDAPPGSPSSPPAQP